MANGWWLDTPADALSQGDVLLPLSFQKPVFPVTFLRSTTGKHNQKNWTESDRASVGADQHFAFLGRAQELPSLVISHDCELDKEKPTVLIAPIFALSALDGAMRSKTVSHETSAFLALQDTPTLGDMYVDFRLLSTVRRTMVDAGKRIGGMTPAGKEQLQARLVRFFTRLDIPGKDS